MKRREFLKLAGALAIVPSLPRIASSKIPYFIYRGYTFKHGRHLNKMCEILYLQVDNWLIAQYIDKDDYIRSRNMYCDYIIHSLERKLSTGYPQ